MTGTAEPETCKPDAEPGAHSCDLADDHEGPHICPRCGGKWVFAATCKAAPDPLVMPADEFAAVKTAGEKLGLFPANPVRAAAIDGILIGELGKRADRAEEKLAALSTYIEEHKGKADFSLVRAYDLLSIIDGEGDECRG